MISIQTRQCRVISVVPEGAVEEVLGSTDVLRSTGAFKL